MKVHLEGMGVVGSMLINSIHEEHDVTWSDVGRLRTAWEACTGAVFPSGHAQDEVARGVWFDWLTRPGFLPGVCAEPCQYVFGSKKPPHAGTYGFHDSVFGLHIAETQSIHVNAQALVQLTRSRFAKNEVKQWDASTKTGPECDLYIVTHGFGKLLAAEWWGWTRPVNIERVDPSLPERAAYYKHLGPVEGPNYAYPIAGSPGSWYAGSTLRRSVNPGVLSREYDKWLERFLKWTDGAVEVHPVGELVSGWRPSATSPALSKGVPDQWLHPHPTDPEKVQVWPCATDGIRRAPLYVAAVKALLEEKS